MLVEISSRPNDNLLHLNSPFYNDIFKWLVSNNGRLIQLNDGMTMMITIGYNDLHKFRSDFIKFDYVVHLSNDIESTIITEMIEWLKSNILRQELFFICYRDTIQVYFKHEEDALIFRFRYDC